VAAPPASNPNPPTGQVSSDSDGVSRRSYAVSDFDATHVDQAKQEHLTRSIHSGTGSTRTTMSRIHQLALSGIEEEISHVRTSIVIQAIAVLLLGAAIVVYFTQISVNVRNRSKSVWLAAQRRVIMENAIDIVTWMGLAKFNANGTDLFDILPQRRMKSKMSLTARWS